MIMIKSLRSIQKLGNSSTQTKLNAILFKSSFSYSIDKIKLNTKNNATFENISNIKYSYVIRAQIG